MDDPILLGEGGAYTLNPRAFRHIMEGDYKQKVDRPLAGGNPILSIAIAGGLHTYSALMGFLRHHPKISSLDAYDPEANEDWYYIRELQNKVLTVKLPKELFVSKAADLTLMPENYYKSGYLWKTLFPKDFSEKDIISAIDQALRNVETHNSISPSDPNQDYHIIGYANVEHPMTAMRIQIQLRGNEIRSAFPSWTQPWTGNNGKAFSHADTISFIMAESVERSSRDHYKLSKIFMGRRPDYESLKRLTPEFTVTRTIPKKGQPHNEWRESRLKTLKIVSQSLIKPEISKIQNYLCDHAITKESSFQQQMLYISKIPYSGNPLDFNACQISQNVYECFYVLLHYDLYRGTDYFLKCMQRFLKASMIHTGGIHLFELKRLHKLFIEGVSLHHDKNSVALFIELLASSPSRAASYQEFNVNTYVKRHDERSMMLIGSSGVTLPITSSILIDFVSLNLGENYLFSFSEEERFEISKRIIFSQTPVNYIDDALGYFTGADFDFFSYHLASLLSLDNKNPVPDKALERIVRDYHRMLVIYRQRLVMDNPTAYSSDPYDLEFMSPEFCDLIIIQHRRKFVISNHEGFLNEIIKNTTSAKISKICNYLLSGISKEGVPMPQYIPDHIESWMKNDAFVRKGEVDLSIFERAQSELIEV
ncbi:hypothetical protein [Pseudomonas sp. GD03696]|uniref:hypothetical protein n=1 Tax=Pseudomonas sp. GD03696 TaxID=2975368 RepID=UPI002447E246|nr:hypothetical protein [Pseudomonas sp. GD03696]MDH1932989.1 EndoU domain-containing protein [Pseudomonas sp. GD03696]